MAILQQRAGEHLVAQAFNALGSENQIFGLAEPIEGAYTELVHQLLGPELFEWLMWWIYETDSGYLPQEFVIQGHPYDPTTMTLYKFLETVDAS